MIDRGLDCSVQRGSGCLGDGGLLLQRVVGLTLDVGVVPEVRVGPGLQGDAARSPVVLGAAPVADPVDGDLTGEEHPVAACDGWGVAGEGRGRPFGDGCPLARPGHDCRVDPDHVDLEDRVLHQQTGLANPHSGRGRPRLEDELVSGVEIGRDRDAGPGVSLGELRPWWGRAR